MEQNLIQRIKIPPEVLKPRAFAFLTITSADILLIFSVWIISFNLPSLPWGKHYYNTVSTSWDVKLGWVVRSLVTVGHRASQWQSFTTPHHMYNRWYFSDLCLYLLMSVLASRCLTQNKAPQRCGWLVKTDVREHTNYTTKHKSI